jgi:acetolactate synthase-1/2/3 large subunit
MAGDRLVSELVEESDLLIGVGFDPTEAIRPFYMDRPFLSVAEYGVAEPAFIPALELIGSVPDTLDALAEHSRSGHDWTPEALTRFRRALAAHLTPSLDHTRQGLSPARVFGRLRDLTPRDTILTVDTGAHKLLVGQVWRSYLPRTYLVSHGLSTMGQALPAALAAKLAQPDRAVIAVTGDGGLAMVVSELETASRLELPVVVVVLCDRGLHLIRLHQERKGFQAAGVDFGPIDFAGIAPGFGCRGVRARTWPEFDAAVAAALASERPTVIEVPVDPADYNQML